MTVEERSTAYHEAGHAVVARALGFRVDRVSRVPRGETLGHVLFTGGRRWLKPRARWRRTRAEVCVLLAGVAAELLPGVVESSEREDVLASGAHHDFDEAFNLLRHRAESTRQRVIREEGRRAAEILHSRRRELEVIVCALEYRRSLGAKTLHGLWEFASGTGMEAAREQVSA